MVGAVVIALVVLLVLPIGFLLGGAALSGILGYFLNRDAEERNEGSEYLDLNT